MNVAPGRVRSPGTYSCHDCHFLTGNNDHLLHTNFYCDFNQVGYIIVAKRGRIIVA